jgi:hypothetical protein
MKDIVILKPIPLESLLRPILRKKFKNKKFQWIDLGTGSGEFLSRIQVIPQHGLAVDIFSPTSPNFPPNFEFIKEDCLIFLEKFNAKVDLLTMFELIEHFDKEKALKLVTGAMRIADLVIISTPEGFLRQDSTTHPEHRDNPFQWHKSGFKRENFVDLGLKTIVLRDYHILPVGNERNFNCLVGMNLGVNQWRSLKLQLKLRVASYFTYHLIRKVLFDKFHLRFLLKFFKKK